MHGQEVKWSTFPAWKATGADDQVEVQVEWKAHCVLHSNARRRIVDTNAHAQVNTGPTSGHLGNVRGTRAGWGRAGGRPGGAERGRDRRVGDMIARRLGGHSSQRLEWTRHCRQERPNDVS